MRGHKVSHSKQRTNRVFRPNLQTKTIRAGAKSLTLKLCTNCIKLLRKIEKEKIAKEQAKVEAPQIA